MVTYDITVGGAQVENLFEVKTGRSETKKVATAEIVASNTATNRSFGAGEEVIIKKNGATEFKGVLMEKPTAGRDDPRITIKAWSKKAELKFEQVNRTFYNKDTGQVIRDAINDEAFALNEDDIHRGSSTANWSSDIPVFQLADISSQSLQERGSNLIFCGWRKGNSGDYYAQFDVDTSDLVGDGQLLQFKTRLLVADQGGQFTLDIELRDEFGNQYVWEDLTTRGQDFITYELNAEDASPDGQVSSDATLEYRFDIKGDLPEPRAAAIDYAAATFYATQSRGADISPTDVQNTGHDIIRRFDGNILQLLTKLETEDDYISWVDDSDVLHYAAAGDKTATKEIDYDTTPVSKAEFNRDYSRIKNKVTVQGSGNIQVVLRDDASIKFYGVSARHEPITDPDLETRDDAIKRGKGFLKQNAWNDTAMKFEVADSSFAEVQVGEAIQVTWPPENINGEFVVTDVETDEWGFVTLSVSGNV
ncbi:baseplate hub [Haloarcula virus HVTV-2]|uniref:Uncharacterized protein n=1 Tax=Haloarcula vallismortis tailed virus 1 TaxID=1262528 RepID=L7TNS8_9CAUD|nr:hypothetical protein HVTV1_133 [Haloarcula vallismortis tailed virus 1]AGC34502.1 hypothetical protein HVTV1_133 [Haloarcula vallismortis tailed virus 1]UBF22941.1 baseplate hub [Haloarcula virus HVTV-2]